MNARATPGFPVCVFGTSIQMQRCSTTRTTIYARGVCFYDEYSIYLCSERARATRTQHIFPLSLDVGGGGRLSIRAAATQNFHISI